MTIQELIEKMAKKAVKYYTIEVRGLTTLSSRKNYLITADRDNIFFGDDVISVPVDELDLINFKTYRREIIFNRGFEPIKVIKI